jgi:formylglycine-generating enzyme required for sulfatase activity
MADRFGKVAAADAALQQWQGAAVLALQGDLKAAADRFQQSQKGWEKARYDGLLKLAVPATVRIAGGTFLMGDRSGKGQRDEQPVHEVTLSAFAMAATETTVAQYDAYAELAGLSPVAANNGGDQDRLPVVNVTHDQAMAYAKWLSKQTGEAWSLPTEEQWEYAARAGGAKEYGQSDSVAGKANCEGCVRWNNKGAQPVAQLPANTYGLYDMQGNVWEWTLGCYTASYAEPKTEADCARYTVRGGSWADLPPELRVSNRSAVPVGERSNRIGFRLVKTQP